MASLTASDRYLRLCLARPLPGAVITALPRYTPVTHAAAQAWPPSLCRSDIWKDLLGDTRSHVLSLG